MWLKADLHMHAKEDKTDNIAIPLKKFIDRAAELKFTIIAATFHNKVLDGKFFKEIQAYAKKKNILIVPGCEAQIDGHDTLIYNITENERKKLKTFEDLRKLRALKEKQGKEILVIAAHPYFDILYIRNCLGNNIIKEKDLFDAIEINGFYTGLVNINRKAIKVATKQRKPLVANGDDHHPIMLGRSYTLINSKKNVNSVIRAIKKNKIKYVTKPLSIFEFLGLGTFFILKNFRIL